MRGRISIGRKRTRNMPKPSTQQLHAGPVPGRGQQEACNHGHGITENHFMGMPAHRCHAATRPFPARQPGDCCQDRKDRGDSEERPETGTRHDTVCPAHGYPSCGKTPASLPDDTGTGRIKFRHDPGAAFSPGCLGGSWPVEAVMVAPCKRAYCASPEYVTTPATAFRPWVFFRRANRNITLPRYPLQAHPCVPASEQIFTACWRCIPRRAGRPA